MKKENVLKDSKKDAFVIFTDLDGTFSPIGLKGLREFIEVVKQIKQKENVDVKFCPVSGRPADYVLSVMHTVDNIAKEEGIERLAEYGAGEQGALMVESKKAYKQTFLGDSVYTNLKEDVSKVLSKNKYSDLLVDEEGKRFTCSIHIKKEVVDGLSMEKRNEIFEDIKKDLIKKLDKNIEIAMSHDCMEIMTPEISKANAINRLLGVLSRENNVKGMMYAGDAENDKTAVKYFSNLAEIPGLKSHVFLPGNAIEGIWSKSIEDWKQKNSKTSSNRILLGEKKNFAGVVELLKKELEKGTLVSKMDRPKKTQDDLDLYMEKGKKNIRLEKNKTLTI